MKRWLTRHNTLRNQMLFGFLLVMLIILCVAGYITYHSVSSLLKNNAEKHIQQTAVQASGRLEAILKQVDMLTTQVATDLYVQELLEKEWHGEKVTFTEQQELQPVVNLIQLYSSGIRSVELFTSENRRLFPLDGHLLNRKISPKWLTIARENKGRLVWIGMDPNDENSVMAVRSISMMNEAFSPGGYLLIRMERELFHISENSQSEDGLEMMLVAGPDNRLIAPVSSPWTDQEVRRWLASNDQMVEIEGERYMLIREKSSMTDWTLLILTPLSEITRGVSVLKTAIWFSAAIGALLFIVLSFMLSTVITRPIFKLIKTMRGIRLGHLQPAEEISSALEINELHRTYNQMVAEMNDLIHLVYEKELLQSRTELKALQAQINPHFLFNTLEALYWSLIEKDEDELADFVVTMSDLFRYTITGSNKDEWVTVRDELDHIERYLSIMKVRFGERISWSIEAEDHCFRYQLPKLLIQPLVENAILHGVEQKIGSGHVNISLRRKEDLLEISVADNGAGMDEETLVQLHAALRQGIVPSSKGTGVGIHNVQQRIRLYFRHETDPSVGISITSQKGAGTEVMLRIPMVMKGGNMEYEPKYIDRG
ncbi:sensor histidine kinase [Marinicrinis lubricantis]|uniref:histidine kinase n=1 Tax=Marinicrinis lubricantis TaxID=2086470 RepID=A0ABW1IQ72_9BACL